MMNEIDKNVEESTGAETTITAETAANTEQTAETAANTEQTADTTVVKKKKSPLIPIIIGVAVLVLAIIAALMIVIFAVAVPGIKHSVQINAGEKYLTELDYDNAILSYEEAIRISPKKEGGYLGLADVYRTMAEENVKQSDYASAISNIEKGIDTLDTGLNKTKSENIKNMLSDLNRKKADLEKEYNTLNGELEAFTNYYYILLTEKDAINYSKPYSDFNKNVAFLDLDGDGIQELVYFRSENYYANYTGHKVLNLVTYKDGEVKEYWTKDGNYEIEAGGGDHMIVFNIPGDSGLYASYDTGDEWWYTYLLRFEPAEDGNLKRENLYLHADGPNEDYTGSVNEYYHLDQPVTEDEYKQGTEAVFGKADKILGGIRGVDFDTLTANSDSAFYQKEVICMTYDEAMEYIESRLGVLKDILGDEEKPYTDEEKGLFATLPEFYFSSGAGAWGSGLTIHPDGSFEADYHDSNMGESGQGYDGTVYYSTARGKFSTPRKLNDYTYVCELLSIEYDGTLGDESFNTYETGYTERSVFSELYGLEDGKIFFIYLKGAPVEELPEAFISWIQAPRAKKEEGSLSCYGFYNLSMQYGFGGDF